MGARTFFQQLGGADAWGTLFDHLPNVFMFAKNLNHKFVMVNRATWTLFGCNSAAGMIGKTDWDFAPPVLAQQYVDEDDRVMRSGRALPDQIWLVAGADGVPLWYLSTKVPLKNGRGKVIGIAGVMRPYEGAGDATSDHATSDHAPSDRAPAGHAPGEYRRLTGAIDHVLKHYGDSIRVADLAKISHLSVSHFQREFHRLFGMSPRDYMMRVRLLAARHRLEVSRVPVGEIALECGFYDQSYFTKCFKSALGINPLEYRRRFGTQAAQGKTNHEQRNHPL